MMLEHVRAYHINKLVLKVILFVIKVRKYTKY
jgi:hypothetical protein